MIKDLQDKINDLSITTNAAFNQMSSATNTFTDALSNPQDKIDALSKQLSGFADRNKNIFGDLAADINGFLSNIKLPAIFNEKAYDAQFALDKANIQQQIDQTNPLILQRLQLLNNNLMQEKNNTLTVINGSMMRI